VDAPNTMGLEKKIEEIFRRVTKLENCFVPEDKTLQGQTQSGALTWATITAKIKKKSSLQSTKKSQGGQIEKRKRKEKEESKTFKGS